MVAFIPTLLQGLTRALGTMAGGAATRTGAARVASTRTGGARSLAGTAAGAEGGGGLGTKELLKLQLASFGAGIATEGIRKLNNSMMGLLRANERLAMVNSNLGKEYAAHSSALHGAEQGFGLAAQAMTEFRILGFKDANIGMINLATRMKISGQDTGKMMKTFQDLLGKGGVSEKNLGHLAETITQNALKYNTTTGSLIGAIGKLSENLLDLNIAGSTAAASDTAASLAAMVGPEFADMAGEFVKLISSTDQSKIDATARLGIESWGDRIYQNIADTNSGMLNELSKVSNVSRSMLGDKGDVRRRDLGALKGVLTNAGIMGTILHDAAIKNLAATDSAKGVIDAIKETIQHLKATFIAPFQLSMAEMGPAFKTMIKSFVMFGGSLLNLIGSFAPVLIVVMDIISLVLRFVSAIAQAIAIIVDVVSFAISPLTSAWDFLMGRGDESVAGPEHSGAKLEAEIASFGQIFGAASPTASIVESNNEISNSMAVTSQKYVTHSTSITSAAADIVKSNKTAATVQATNLGSTSRSTNAAVTTAAAVTTLVQQGDEAKSRIIRQNVTKNQLNNRDLDNKLFAIADAAARENAAGHAYYLELMAKGIDNISVSNNGILQKTVVPAPPSALPSAPNLTSL